MRLLLDSHVPVAIAAALREREVDALHLREWRGGELLHSPDSSILASAFDDRRVFVTRDRRTVGDLVRQLWEAGARHAGIVFVDHEAFPPMDIGGMVRALIGLVHATNDWDWTDRIVTLRPVERG